MKEKNNRIITTIEGRETIFLTLYKTVFPTVASYIARMGGSLEEAQDIFQDTLIIYYEKIASTQVGIIVNDKAYLLCVAKYLYNQNLVNPPIL